ncbi:ABC transporter ATP-binding protein [Bacteriovorax stolpii]|uniref:ABC transporter ATP-binding protein n=1 Tax=Bacteriovorax stolpii TaxID=960 RepID=A0A2K9NVB2_BACTC|nr:ABC transporter ATP-binding protein [Bacteriovorax stolpii]AUN98704.1 ABC transporter ATP-binding protein [Bacteriovorax stolpii]TDP55786.1 ABC-2 type transport system ATP-binding protein [Bacteriovorax stolpii]
MDIIQIKDISKSYGLDFSLQNVSLNVQKGKIFSLLGPNGAGKTTLVKLMLNLLHSDSGTIEINGLSVSDKNSRMGIAFIPEKFNFFPFYTARGVLEFFGKMKGIEGAELTSQVNAALAELQISELAERKLSKMSKGQVQRVGLASILIGNNDLIILDEPFSGLDPIGIRDLKEIIRKLKGQGKTLFINSHILLEMEQLCDEIAILNKGQVLFAGSVPSVLEKEKSLDDFFYKIVNGARA